MIEIKNSCVLQILYYATLGSLSFVYYLSLVFAQRYACTPGLASQNTRHTFTIRGWNNAIFLRGVSHPLAFAILHENKVSRLKAKEEEYYENYKYLFRHANIYKLQKLL